MRCEKGGGFDDRDGEEERGVDRPLGARARLLEGLGQDGDSGRRCRGPYGHGGGCCWGCGFGGGMVKQASKGEVR